MTAHSMKRALALVTQCFPPQFGGIQNLMANLAYVLHTHFTITVIADAKEPLAITDAWDQQQPYTIHRVSGPKLWRKWRKQRLLYLELIKHPQQAVIFDTWKSAEYLVTTGLACDAVMIALAHGNDVLTQERPAKAKRIQRTLSRIQHVAAVSHDTYQRVRELGIQHCSILHNGVRLTPHTPSQHPDRPFPHLLTIGRLEARKGQDQVLRALRTLKGRWPTIHYTIAGTGKDRARLETLIAEWQLTPHVTLLGNIDEPSKTALLHTADLFVMPVRHDITQHSIEGFGMALAEAQLAGCPVLTGRVGGVLDVVQDHSTGYTCDGHKPQDVLASIQKILSDPEGMAACTQRARRYAAQSFSIAAMGHRYVSLIDRLSDRSQRPTQPLTPQHGVQHDRQASCLIE